MFVGRVLVPPRTENTYILDTLVRSGVEFGSLQPPASRRVLPILMTLIPFMYVVPRVDMQYCLSMLRMVHFVRF